jgi:hypothetical protein
MAAGTFYPSKLKYLTPTYEGDEVAVDLDAFKPGGATVSLPGTMIAKGTSVYAYGYVYPCSYLAVIPLTGVKAEDLVELTVRVRQPPASPGAYPVKVYLIDAQMRERFLCDMLSIYQKGELFTVTFKGSDAANAVLAGYVQLKLEVAWLPGNWPKYDSYYAWNRWTRGMYRAEVDEVSVYAFYKVQVPAGAELVWQAGPLGALRIPNEWVLALLMAGLGLVYAAWPSKPSKSRGPRALKASAWA